MRKLSVFIIVSIFLCSNLYSQNADYKVKSLNVKAGFSVFNFSDPSLLGQNSFFYTAGSGSGDYNGYRNFTGIFVKLSYYLNNNFGVFGDASINYSGKSYYVDPVSYKNNADMNFIKLGVTGQVIGNDYPVRVNTGVGVAIGVYDFYHEQSSVGTGTYLGANGAEVGLCLNVELTVPIYKSIHFVSQLEYLYIPVSELTFENAGGSDYYQRYYDANLGGYNLKIGVSVDIL